MLPDDNGCVDWKASPGPGAMMPGWGAGWPWSRPRTSQRLGLLALQSEADFHVPQGLPDTASCKIQSTASALFLLALLRDHSWGVPRPSGSCSLEGRGSDRVFPDGGHCLQFCETYRGGTPADDRLVCYPLWLSYYLSIKHRGSDVDSRFQMFLLALIFALDSHIIIAWIFGTTIWEKKIK